MRYRILLLDFDGTLFNTRRAVRAAMNAVAVKRRGYGFRSDVIDVAIGNGLTLDGMFSALMPALDP